MNINIPWKYIVLLPAVFMFLVFIYYAVFPPVGDGEGVVALLMATGPVSGVCFILHLIIKSRESK